MREMIKKLTAAALAVGMLSLPAAFAEASKLEISQEGTQTVVLSGCLGTENANLGVTAQVYVQGYDFDDLKAISEGANVFDMIKFHDETVTDSEGNYEFKFDLTTESQWLTPYVSTKNEKVGGSEYDYMFVNDTEWKTVAKTINDAAKSSSDSAYKDILTCLEEDFLVMGYSKAEMSAINTEKLAKVILNTVKEESLPSENRDDSWLELKQALMVERLNEGKIEDIYDEPISYTELDESDIKSWYGKSFITDKLKADFTERLSGCDFKSYGEYKKALAEAFVLSTVRYPNGVDNIKDIFGDFEDEIGVNVNEAENHVWSSLSGRNYKSYEALASGFKTLNKKTNDGGGSSSSSGGSSNKKGYVSDYSGNIFDISGSTASAEPMLNDIFSDLGEAEWAREAIKYLAEKQIVSGVGNDCFAPNESITREQFAKIAVGAFSIDGEGEIGFSDVPADSWFAPYIKKAYAAGVVNGMSEDIFGTGLKITRQDMCVMIYRAAKQAGYEITAEDYALFADDEGIADYAREAVYSLRECGAVNGLTETEFAPYEYATRAQAAKIIYYLIKEM